MREIVPLWIGEGKVQRADANMDEATGRDLSPFSGWRKTASADNLELIEMYGNLLIGQYAGMGQALNLEAVIAAFRIEGIPRSEWGERARRLIVLNALFVEHTKDRK